MIRTFTLQQLKEKAHVHAMLVGPTGSGKSYFLLNRFLPMYLKAKQPRRIYYFSEHIHNHDTTDLEEYLESPEVQNDLSEYGVEFFAARFSSNKLTRLLSLYEQAQEVAAYDDEVMISPSLIIFNDIAPNALDKTMGKNIIWLRHLNIDTLCMVQYYTMLAKTIRANVNLYMIKNLGSTKDITIFRDEIVYPGLLRDFIRFVEQYTSTNPRTQHRKTLIFSRPQNKFFTL